MTYEIKIQSPATFAKHATAPFEWKMDEAGVFAGYASVFHLVDSQRDAILPGAFSETLKLRPGEVKLLWQHDQKEPIGVIEELREDDNGLYMRGRLLLDVAKGREAYSLLKQGVVSGLSIGYSPKRYHVDPDTGVRTLSALDLWEVSLVTFPANHAAQVTVVKHETPAWDVAAYEDSREWKEAVRSGMVMRLCHELERATRILAS